jgi:hypothetical protein
MFQVLDHQTTTCFPYGMAMTMTTRMAWPKAQQFPHARIDLKLQDQNSTCL